MARITVEDCLEVVDNRFELVMMAAKRARQLAGGVEPKLDNSEANDKPTVLALRSRVELVVDPSIHEASVDITLTTTARTDDEGRALLRAFKFPFRN